MLKRQTTFFFVVILLELTFSFPTNGQTQSKPTPTPKTECPIEFDYQRAGAPNTPDFVIRAGYSRDNDDPAEGNFETGVFDLEILGRKSRTKKFVCLHAVIGFTMSSHLASADAYASGYVLRVREMFARSNERDDFIQISDPVKAWHNFTLNRHPYSSPPFLNEKLGKYRDNRKMDPRLQGATLRSEIYLGQFVDGEYKGIIYAGSPTSKQNGSLIFSSAKDDNYNNTRHVIEWRFNLEQLELVIDRTMHAEIYANESSETPYFTNQIRFRQPAWHNTITNTSFGNAAPKMELKKHRATLMWRDILNKEMHNNIPAYRKIDLLPIQKEQNNPASDEEFGRLRETPFDKATGRTRVK